MAKHYYFTIPGPPLFMPKRIRRVLGRLIRRGRIRKGMKNYVTVHRGTYNG